MDLDIPSLVLGSLLTALLKLLYAITGLEKVINGYIKLARASLRRKPREVDDERFCIGYRRTSMFILDGDGETTYSPESLRAIYRDGTPDSPHEIAERIRQKEYELEEAHRAGQSKAWNGIGVGVKHLNVLRNDNEDVLAMNIEFFKSTYAGFQATVVAIGSEDNENPESTYARHITGTSLREPIPHFARHVGVVVCVVTSDDMVLIAKRGEAVRVRPNEFDASVVEGIEPTKDCKSQGTTTGIDIYATVRRGCQEELGFTPNAEKINILGFAVDTDYYQYNFFAYVEADRTLDEFKKGRAGKAKDTWEFDMKTVKFTPKELLLFISQEKMWGPAILAFYWALVHRYTKNFVEPVAAQYFGTAE